MVMIGKTDDSEGTGKRVYYTVLLKEGVMADVMTVYDMEDGERLDTVYIMELEDGGTVCTYEAQAIQGFGFDVCPFVCLKRNAALEEIETEIQKLKALAEDMQIPIDGMVLR